ncbi:YqaJ viral recombinase family protein [Pusillimonas sp. ANT_WB101]|uniref:YqaJ viral recombinase family protein n=1 Tax=Pusillimonas sp. ANT_WB101 TaxID=2597356 RepID=UPI0011EFB49B|nr:YqaJ viral recombinase family protein [Pusillimonas sp. ANT_WB101]KAA0910647.1 Heme peroxidase [Pusillimonas sp. ANT_WB101]
MKIHNVIQGTAEWLALRFKCLTASEAPVMMAASSKLMRSELLRMKATGADREYSDWVQKNLFDKGHQYEALARPIVEEMIGEELYPTTATDDEVRLLASFDGITMLGEIVFEHKMWNEELAQAVRDKNLPAEYYWQLEQQLLVSKAEKAIFVVSDGTRENFVWMEYRPLDGRALQLVAGWAQFETDLNAYHVVEEKPKAVGRTPENLPALRIEVTGMVTNSNLVAFKEHALAVIGSINRELVTDQHFADADKTIKWCKEVEDRLEAAKQHALSQTASIDALFRTLDEIGEEARATRLELNRLVTTMKENRRNEILMAGKKAFADHVAALNKRLGTVRLPEIACDIAVAMKGKRTIATLQDAADSTVAAAKIQASMITDKITENLDTLCKMTEDYSFLFADAQQLVLKDNDDLVLLINARINNHKQEEQARLDSEREKIRLEEIDKLAKQKALDDAQTEKEAQAARTVIQGVQDTNAKPANQETLSATPEPPRYIGHGGGYRSHAPAPETAKDDGTRLRLGEINALLAPLNITSQGLSELGFEHVATDKSARLYRECDFPRICAALMRHIEAISQTVAA